MAVGLQPVDIEMRASLSPAAAANLEAVVHAVVGRLADWGYTGTESGTPTSA